MVGSTVIPAGILPVPTTKLGPDLSAREKRFVTSPRGFVALNTVRTDSVVQVKEHMSSE
jgi:hypothetical protein